MGALFVAISPENRGPRAFLNIVIHRRVCETGPRPTFSMEKLGEPVREACQICVGAGARESLISILQKHFLDFPAFPPHPL
jgi:hypothetical protein